MLFSPVFFLSSRRIHFVHLLLYRSFSPHKRLVSLLSERTRDVCLYVLQCVLCYTVVPFVCASTLLWPLFLFLRPHCSPLLDYNNFTHLVWWVCDLFGFIHFLDPMPKNLLPPPPSSFFICLEYLFQIFHSPLFLIQLVKFNSCRHITTKATTKCKVSLVCYMLYNDGILSKFFCFFYFSSWFLQRRQLKVII